MKNSFFTNVVDIFIYVLTYMKNSYLYSSMQKYSFKF